MTAVLRAKNKGQVPCLEVPKTRQRKPFNLDWPAITNLWSQNDMLPDLHCTTDIAVPQTKNLLYLSGMKKKKSTWNPLGPKDGLTCQVLSLLLHNYKRTLSDPISLPPRQYFCSRRPSKEWPELSAGTRFLFSSINSHKHVATSELLMFLSHFTLKIFFLYWDIIDM